MICIEGLADAEDLCKAIKGEKEPEMDKDYMDELADKLSRSHPNYPNVGYKWNGELMVECFLP